MSNREGNLVRRWLNGGGNRMGEWGVGWLLAVRGRNGFGCGRTSVGRRGWLGHDKQLRGRTVYSSPSSLVVCSSWYDGKSGLVVVGERE